MKCPKCGFSQPDDIYCALCGINIGRYARKRKKQHYKIGLFALLIGVAGLAVANHFISPSIHNRIEITAESEFNKPSTQLHQKTRSDMMTRKTDSAPSTRKDRSPEHQALDTEQFSFESSSQGNEEYSQAQNESTEQLETAPQWFEKGKGLDDDSEAETECYKKAIELDPRFAPAAFRLAAIYFRQGKYELTDNHFANFLKYASDQEKQTYNIYVYYSLADVERLSESIRQEAAAQLEEEQTPSQAEGETGERLSDEETAPEMHEEIMTVVEFHPTNGHITVPVVLNGSLTATVLVDTGAGITILSREVAQELGLRESRDKSITLRTMALDIHAQLAQLDSIQVGDLSRHNFPVAIAPDGFGTEAKFNGILGMDFMKNYKIYIDNEKNKFMLTPKAL
ncbi:MAG: hypothetical protein BBJ60_06060 [Desulfobacterales bacterium S7086C20]|nr:MAG: hypothetical protein BBJ60_06060 [Desulfobacterales bacterium S7086C20]